MDLPLLVQCIHRQVRSTLLQKDSRQDLCESPQEVGRYGGRVPSLGIVITRGERMQLSFISWAARQDTQPREYRLEIPDVESTSVVPYAFACIADSSPRWLSTSSPFSDKAAICPINLPPCRVLLERRRCSRAHATEHLPDSDRVIAVLISCFWKPLLNTMHDPLSFAAVQISDCTSPRHIGFGAMRELCRYLPARHHSPLRALGY